MTTVTRTHPSPVNATDRIAAVDELSQLAFRFPARTTEYGTGRAIPPTLAFGQDFPNADPPDRPRTTALYGLLPDLMRRREIPSRHRVVKAQVGNELITHNGPHQGLRGDLESCLKKDNEEGKKKRATASMSALPLPRADFDFSQPRFGRVRITGRANPRVCGSKRQKRGISGT